MPESIHSTGTNTTIPRIPEPVVLTWAPDLDDGDVAYIAGTPFPPGPPPPSMASDSTISLPTVRGHSSSPLPPRPPPPSLASESNGLIQHWGSTVSLARATIGEDSDSRRLSLIEETPAVNDAMEEDPPQNAGNAGVRTSIYPIDYGFVPIEGDSESMLVVPLSVSSTHEAAAAYHIKVTHDLFDPSFFVTTVRKGGRSNGTVIGDFKTKPDCSTSDETVFFEKTECHIFKKLTNGSKKDEFHWKLHNRSDGLLLWKWDDKWTCRHVPDNTVIKNKIYDPLAEFYPPFWMRTPANPIAVARLTVYPPGQKFFDEILIAVLILERKRRKIVTRKGRGI